ncbi:MAG: 3-deoxy-7-phosphoheptulonate synthase [Defluviitaleaceae bacterium]|nr:3-deoxy-7-phosphoheptulonate synthase [Defluviitaleaceae bacterium]
MIIILKSGATEKDTEPLLNFLQTQHVIIQDIQGESTKMIGLAGDTAKIQEESVMGFACVERVMRVQEPYKLAGRKFHPQDTSFEVNGIKVGGGSFNVIAGPCSVESEEQILSIARDVKASGAAFLRGGAFKPRTSPYSFLGLGMEGLELLKIAKAKTGLPIVSEIMSSQYLDAFAEYVDIIQIGTRNSQNFTLLAEVGRLKKPVLLKRGMSGTIEELLMSAEYIMAAGSPDVILCERGIRTFETATRNTLDLSAIPVLKARSHLPVFVDPSHATGHWSLVETMSLAAVAAGADGLEIEVHNHPEAALSDGAQSLTPQLFDRLMGKIGRVREAIAG